MEDEKLVKMFNPTLIVVINGLIWIDSNIGLDTCARGRWRVEVSKMEMNRPLGYYGKWRAINPLNGLSVWAFSFFRNSLSHH